MRKVTSLALAGCLLLSSPTISLANDIYVNVVNPVLTPVLYQDNVPADVKATLYETKPEVISHKLSDKLIINEKEVDLGSRKIYKNAEGITMIPLRVVCEELGYEVSWNENINGAEIRKGALWSMIKVGEDYYTYGKMAPMKLGAAAELLPGTTFVPLNFVTEILRGELKLDTQGVINISTEQSQVKLSSISIHGKITEITKTEKNTMIWVEGKVFGEEVYDETMVLNISERTKLIDPLINEGLSLADLKVGDMVRGFYGPAVTSSIPPQASAERLEVLNNVDVRQGIITEIINNGQSKQIHLDGQMDGIVLNLGDDCKIVNKDNEELAFDDLHKGLKIEALHDLKVTKSLPPITNVKKIIVIAE